MSHSNYNCRLLWNTDHIPEPPPSPGTKVFLLTVDSCMGSVCSSTEIVWQGSFDMPDVHCQVAEAICTDPEAALSFFPNLLAVEIVRGEPAKAGTCWLEWRQVGKHRVVLRKTITKSSKDPFTQRAMIELTETNNWTLPAFIATSTLTIKPGRTGDGSSSIQWTDALISEGIISRLMSAFCVPCLKYQWIAHVQEEWQYYYEESLRRTIDP